VVAIGEGDEPRRRSGVNLDQFRSGGINNNGDIIGYGDYRGGTYGFLLTPDSATAVPELSTWAMMLAGFVGLGFAGYRQTSRQGRVIWRMPLYGRRFMLKTSLIITAVVLV
jgi:hypothetical protein